MSEILQVVIKQSAVFQEKVFGSLVATTGTTLSFPYSEPRRIHRGLERGLLKSDAGAITVRSWVRNKVGGFNSSCQMSVSKSQASELYQVI